MATPVQQIPEPQQLDGPPGPAEPFAYFSEDERLSGNDVPPADNPPPTEGAEQPSQPPPRPKTPRKLNQKDREQLRDMYTYAAMALYPIREKTAQTINDCADKCVDAWADLAAQDPAIRRAIIKMLEGGAWGAVIMAHAPILFTLIPEKALERMPMMFGNPDGDEESE